MKVYRAWCCSSQPQTILLSFLASYMNIGQSMESLLQVFYVRTIYDFTWAYHGTSVFFCTISSYAPYRQAES